MGEEEQRSGFVDSLPVSMRAASAGVAIRITSFAGVTSLKTHRASVQRASSVQLQNIPSFVEDTSSAPYSLAPITGSVKRALSESMAKTVDPGTYITTRRSGQEDEGDEALPGTLQV